MNSLQAELKSQFPLLRIQIAAVNQYGQESQNSVAAADKTLPLLQDVDANANAESDVWASWDAVWRDVRVLNGDNIPIANMNLTANDLRVAANYAALREGLIDAAMMNQLPWKNAANALDVDGDTRVVPIDVLRVVNTLNEEGSRKLAPPTGQTLTGPFFDTNGDGSVSPVDALLVINDINSRSSTGEGEMSDSAAVDALFADDSVVESIASTRPGSAFATPDVASLGGLPNANPAVSPVVVWVAEPARKLFS